MTTTVTVILLIVGSAVVTWLPRIIPFVFVKRMKMPDIALRWLAYIPVCILSALVLETLFEKDRSIVTLNVEYTLAFIPTLVVALWTKSLFGTVMTGIVAMACIRFFL